MVSQDSVCQTITWPNLSCSQPEQLRTKCEMQIRALFEQGGKYHCDHVPAHENWVFGVVDPSVESFLRYVQLVLSCDAATLLPITAQHVSPGTIIWSDQRLQAKWEDLLAVACTAMHSYHCGYHCGGLATLCMHTN